jgi:hypothetical protein
VVALWTVALLKNCDLLDNLETLFYLVKHRGNTAMRIAYVVPGPMSKGPMGLAEMRRREALLNSWAFPGTEVTVVDVPDGPASIESRMKRPSAFPLRSISS